MAQPDGTAGEFTIGLPFGPAGPDTPDADAALVALAVLASDAAGNAANLIKAALAPFFTAIGALISNLSQRTVLEAANAGLDRQVADLQHQLEQSTTDLTAAQAKLAGDQKLLDADPKNQDLIDAVATDLTNITAIQANIASLNQSIAQGQGQSAANTAQIAALEATAVTGFTAIASAVVQRLSEELQKAAAQNQTVAATVQGVYDDLRTFLDDAQVAEVLRLVQQRAEDDADTATRVAAASGLVTNAPQTPALAPAQPPQNDSAIPRNVSRTVPNQAAASSLATSSTIAPTNDPQPAVQIATLAATPADDTSDDQEDEQADIAAAEATRQQQEQDDLDEIRVRAENTAEPAATERVSQAPPPPQNPVTNVNASTRNTERAALQKSITDDTVERGGRGNTDARATDVRLQQQNALIADMTKKADELVTALDRLVNRFVKPPATASSVTPLGDSVTVATLQNQQIPGRRKIPV